MLEAVEIETGRNPTGTVILLHGLGAYGRDFAPIVPQPVEPPERPLRFVFPHAPVRPVTINRGMAMRAWYDILGFNRGAAQDEVGIRASDAEVHALIQRENQRGIATNRIVLAGFSQGAAMALFSGTRYPEKLAGIMAMSGYMVLAPKFDSERANENQTVPVFLAHGTEDPVVGLQLGEDTHQLLEATQYSVEWHTYPMGHSVCPQEIGDIAEWLRRVI